MELVLRARASLKKKGLISSSRIDVQDVARALLDGTEGTSLEAHARARAPGPNGPFIVNLHPAADPVAIRVNGDAVELEAQTHSVGPGYHAFLVSLMDKMQTSLGLQWEWLDPTDYARKRDLTALQSRMAEGFRAMCGDLVKQAETAPGGARAPIFLPDRLSAAASRDEVFTPLGPTTLKQVAHWASLDGAELRKVSADLSLWWDQGFGGSFYRGLVQYWLWMEVRWATPLDKDEADFIIGVLDAYSSALEHHADLPIPQAAITELFALVEGKLTRHVADPQGIGYRRRDWARHFGGNWLLVMPGSLEPSEEDKDGKTTYVFSADRLDVRASVYDAPSDDPRIRAGEFDGEVSLLERYIEKFDRTVTIRNLAKTHRLGARTSICIMTITSSTPETRVIGERIGKSLTYVP